MPGVDPVQPRRRGRTTVDGYRFVTRPTSATFLSHAVYNKVRTNFLNLSMFFAQTRKPQLEIGRKPGLCPAKYRVHDQARSTHTYVIGVTGKGKSKLLEHLLFQDVTYGNGCGVLDPHSDLADDLLRYLLSHPQRAARHWSRIIYFDPSRSDYLIPFNVLKSGFPAYETAQNIVEAFRRTWPKALDEAPRFANIATAGVLTLIANGLTLVELPRLLTDRLYRETLIEPLEDPELVAFWTERYEKWGRETPLMVESILNKVTAFTLNPQLRLLLGAEDNGLDFRRIMDEGRVLIVNLGRCDAETRRLIGSLIVTGLEQAARARRDQRERRRPFYFCIDEFQDFCANDGAAQTLAQILSECRKFGLHLTLSHQTLSQVNERMKGALGNIQLKIVFGVSRQDAEILARHLFQINGEQVKHRVRDADQQTRSHPVYYSLPEVWERCVQSLQNLPGRHAFVQSRQQQQAVRIRTTTIRHAAIDEGALDAHKLRLLKRVAMRTDALARQISTRVSTYAYDQINEPPQFKETLAPA